MFFNNQNILIAVVLVIVSLKLFFDHRKADYAGVYKPYSDYKNISALKHDMFKAFFLELFPIIVYGLAVNEKLFDSNNFLGSWVGKTVVILAGYLVYYELIQPHIVNKIKSF